MIISPECVPRGCQGLNRPRRARMGEQPGEPHPSIEQKSTVRSDIPLCSPKSIHGFPVTRQRLSFKTTLHPKLLEYQDFLNIVQPVTETQSSSQNAHR
jgi:hypothetical protein